jgi:hypothetical protein
MAGREEDLTEEEYRMLDLLRKLVGSRGGDINDFDQQYVEPTAAENYGYVNKPGFMSLTGMLPGPMGIASRVTSGMINQGNNQAIRRAREALGLPNEKPSFLGDVYKSPKDGKVAEVTIGNQDYPVGLEAKTKDNRTTLTPNEARMRGLANGGMVEKDVPEKKTTLQRVKDSVFGKKDDMDEGTNHLHAGLGLSYDTEGGKYQPLSGLHDTGRKLSDVSGIAIHHTGGRGTPEGVVNTLNQRGLGVQYVMDRDGTIYSTGSTDEREAHIRPAENGSGLSNDNTLGIEVIANDDSDLTPEQIKSGISFINDQISRNPDIGLNVFGHGELNSHKQDTEGMSIVNAYRNWRDDALNRPAVPTERPDPGTMIAEQDKPKDNGAFSALMSPSEKTGSGITVDPNRFKDITDDEKTLMGMTLAGEIDPSKTDLTTEAGRREAMGILSTIENRSPKYGSITETITAPKQYSTWNNEAAANTAANNYHGNKSVYDTLVSDYISDPQNNLGFTSYHANYVNPGWSNEMQNKENIGPHTFGFLDEYSAKPSFTQVQPHTVFNTSASYAPHMSGMVSDVNANKTQSQSQLASTASSKPSSTETRETSSESRGFSSMGTGGSSGFGAGGSGSSTGGSRTSSMTGTSANAGKDKDDKNGASSSFSGGRTY